MTDSLDFQKSITDELDVIQNRVRNLIGSANWGEDGRYKEAILRKIIRRFLPSYLSIGTGFVVDRDQVSKQIDIIIYDNTIPPLFVEGNFVITTPANVRAIIEVKSSFRANIFQNAIENAKYNGELIAQRRPNVNLLQEEGFPTIFNGIFFYTKGDVNDRNIKAILTPHLGSSNGYISHITIGPNYFVRRWEKEDAERFGGYLFGTEQCRNRFYNVYKIKNLAFSYFISNLLHLLLGINL